MTIIDSQPRNTPRPEHGKPSGSAADHFGRFGEECAARWYHQNGYEVLHRNWRCSRGELDLIVSKGTLVAFVEVKARSSRRFGSGAEAVDWRKQTRIRSLASHWLAANPSYFSDLRFDVVDVDARGALEVFQGCF